MKLLLKRVYLGTDYTIGKLYVDGKYICDTLEDTIRDLNKNGKFDNGEVKLYGQTAIPYGTYDVVLDVISPKFRNSTWARPYNGKVPRLLNVPSFEGVLIHPGNGPENTYGCILVGENTIKGRVINSVNTFHKLMYELNPKDKITITIE